MASTRKPRIADAPCFSPPAQRIRLRSHRMFLPKSGQELMQRSSQSGRCNCPRSDRYSPASKLPSVRRRLRLSLNNEAACARVEFLPNESADVTSCTPRSVRTAENGGELRARPPVLTPVPSRASHSSLAAGSRRVRLPRNLHACFDSLVRLSTPEKVAHMWESLARVSNCMNIVIKLHTC